MRYSKRRVKTCKKRRHAKNCKCRNATKRRVSKTYRRRRIMKGGWGGATIMDTVLKPFKKDEDNSSMYGGWGELPMA